MSRLERWSLFSSILIWIGVLVFGIGLVVTLRNQRIEQPGLCQPGHRNAHAGCDSHSSHPLPTQTPSAIRQAGQRPRQRPVGALPLGKPKTHDTKQDTTAGSHQTHR